MELTDVGLTVEIEPTRGKYILDDENNVVPETHLLKWAIWLENAGSRRSVGRDSWGERTVFLRTSFIGLDHSSLQGSVFPLVFETFVLIADDDDRVPEELRGVVGHCSTWVEAVLEHAFCRQRLSFYLGDPDAKEGVSGDGG